jgi:hypothetical protein
MVFFEGYVSSIPRYDELFDKAGGSINEASFLYAQFVTEVLGRIQGEISLPGIEIPVYHGDGFSISHTQEILFDEGQRFPMVRMSDDTMIPFAELNIIAQDLIAQHIFIEIKTVDVYRALFSEENHD